MRSRGNEHEARLEQQGQHLEPMARPWPQPPPSPTRAHILNDTTSASPGSPRRSPEWCRPPMKGEITVGAPPRPQAPITPMVSSRAGTLDNHLSRHMGKVKAM
jgi:hypothetical protein